jgi:SOS-response transcriptional repressor LexA
MAAVEIPPRQFDLLVVLNHHTQRRGFAPSIRELCWALGVTSTNAVSDLMNGLIRKGLITKSAGMARTTRVTPRGRKALRQVAP